MRFETLHISVDVNSGVSRGADAGFDATPGAPFWKRLFSFRAAFSVFLIICASFVVGIFSIRAHSVSAYPATCLGGWQEPSQAAGIPESASGAAPSVTNSALLPENTAAQIFCSGFSADIPPDTRVTGASLRFFIASYVPAEAADPEAPVQDNPAPSEETPPLPADDVPAASDEESAVEPQAAVEETPPPASEIPAEEVHNAPPESIQNPTPPVEEIPESAPAAFRFVHYAEAEELENGSDYETGDTAPIDVFEEIPSEPAVSSVSEEGEVLGESTGPVAAEPFLEIAVTFDGIEWHTLRTLAAFELGRTEVSVPLPEGFDWHNLDSFQVVLRNIPTLSSQPGVLAEGMELLLSYESIPGEAGTLEELAGAVFGGGAESDEETVSDLGDIDEDGIEQPIIPDAPPRHPPVRARIFEKTLSVDLNAPHSCSVAPFRVDAFDGGDYEAVLKLSPGAQGNYDVDIGSLPAGVRVVVGEGYEYATTDAERKVRLSVSSSENADEGDFNVPVFYTERETGVSAVCQLNVVTARAP